MKKFFILSLSIFLLISVSTIAQDNDQIFRNKLMEVQQRIDAAGGKWHAGDSHIARMSPEEFSQLLGLLDDPNPPEFYGIERFKAPLSLAALPQSYSLQGNMTSVKNQGSCGSCWAFAACAAFEGTLNLSTGNSYDLSEQLLVSTCCSAGDCGGGWPGEVASFIASTGVPEENCYPYIASNSSCSDACSNWEEIAIRANSTYSVGQSVNDIKAAIYTHGPVHLGFNVMSDFGWYSGGIYEWNGSGGIQGKHAVTAVGWDDSSGGYFIVKNSWGSGWGESGYFRIAYSQVNNTVGFGQMGNVFGQ